MSRIRSPGRRHWLLRLLQGGLALLSLVLLYPIVRFLKPPSKSPGAQEVVAPFRANELRPGADGKWPSPFNFGGRPCLVIKSPEGEICAFDAVCTHVDCTVTFRPEHGDIFCNCHNGVYDLKGRNVSGPPPRPLTSHKVVLRGKPGQEEIVVIRDA